MNLRRRALPYFIGLAVLALPSAAGFNMYLLKERPVIAGLRKSADEPNILCGRVSGPVYCVRITDADARMNMLLFLLAAIATLPAVLFLIASGKSNANLDR